ncbi:MAG TPA: SDR family oxidoreductase [Solirubrobacterales bacterium]|nr:SDR family oxidoreductase [Solirubrobacterales bacterium]
MSEPRIVLVTGGSRGIGAAIATAFLAEGDTVVVCGRREPDQPPSAAGRTVEFVQADVRDASSAVATIETVLERHGRLDLLVNNAGGTPPGPAAEMSADSATAVVTLNLLAPFFLAQRANAAMQEQPDGGTIINIGSTAERRPAPGTALYAAAKSGLHGLTRALALEWAPKVRVVQVSPGPVETAGSARHYGGEAAFAASSAQIGMGRFARPEDVAGACVLLADPRARYVSGAELFVDGAGEIPGWLTAIEALPRDDA